MTREVALTKGKVALIDDSDFATVSQHKWFINNGYASTRIGDKQVSLHRFIMNARKGEEIDHINMNRLDCRRSNLRLVTRSQNLANRSVQKNNKTGFKGVYRRGATGKYRASIRVFLAKKHLGDFDTAEEAAKAYDAAARRYYGKYARTNF